MKQNSFTFPTFVQELDGTYTVTRSVEFEELLDFVSGVIEQRLQRDGVLGSPDATRRYLVAKLGSRDQEIFSVLFLDNRHRIIAFEELFYGTIDGATVHPREVTKRALQLNAAALIMAHNHPSGVAEPSEADKRITKRLKDALALVDCRVLDHFVIAGNTTVSFAERGLI